jgi:AhpD family alkylhydroperoxidase
MKRPRKRYTKEFKIPTCYFFTTQQTKTNNFSLLAVAKKMFYDFIMSAEEKKTIDTAGKIACAFCLHMHTRDARKGGESQERLDLIGAWREAPVFSSRERAALAWTEAVTRLADSHVPDDVYEVARAEFSERELVDLTMAVVAINGWNRLMVAFRVSPAVSRNA